VPDEVLAQVAEALVAQTEAGWLAQRKKDGWWTEEGIQREIAERNHQGNCLFVIARVCRRWRKAQLKVGGPLRTRVGSDVIAPGRVALAKWALAEGCPREGRSAWWGSASMAEIAAEYGHMELVRWLIQEQGFPMGDMGDRRKLMGMAARGGNLELVRWLRGEGCDWSAFTCQYAAARGHLEVLQWLRANGCPWDTDTCYQAVYHGHVETLRWARANGCPWRVGDRDRAAAELGYTDDLVNLMP